MIRSILIFFTLNTSMTECGATANAGCGYGVFGNDKDIGVTLTPPVMPN